MNNSIPRDVQLLLASREQYKNKNIKQYIALGSADSMGVEVSGETCLLAQRQASDPLAVAFSNISSESATSSPGESGNVICPREQYTRWSGISVHHVRTSKGVKIGITLQKPTWQREGRTLQITAELKRYNRLREVRALPDDSEFFRAYVQGIKDLIHSERTKTACLGRAHQRGARRAWIQDTLVYANLSVKGIQEVTIYIEGDQFTVPMNHEMSEQQARVYHCSGLHGDIRFNRRNPSIHDLPTVQHG